MAALPLQDKIDQTIQLNYNSPMRLIQLGNGNSQRVPDGKPYWEGTIQWNPLTLDEWTTLLAFLRTIGSWDLFDYTPPGDVEEFHFAVDPKGPSVTSNQIYWNVSITVRSWPA